MSTISSQYDSYLEQHKANVKKGFEWIREHMPDILQGDFDYEWQICLNHDHSKTEPDEYEAYDAYFYGGNRSFDVVQNFNKAWLLHIHRNPHHWQYWVLINDEPNEGEIVIQMPHNYIVEMICDWWAFSWNKGDLTEIFSWYEERKNYIKMHKNTRKTVEDIFAKIKEALNNDLSHHGIKGQKWGVRNGPPYPIDKSNKSDKMVLDAIDSGEISTTVKIKSQKLHTKDGHTPGRSYLDGDLDYAQRLINKLSGTGEPVVDSKGNWRKKERVVNSTDIGVYVDNTTGKEKRTNKAMIIYSKDGAHIYPRH